MTRFKETYDGPDRTGDMHALCSASLFDQSSEIRTQAIELSTKLNHEIPRKGDVPRMLRMGELVTVRGG